MDFSKSRLIEHTDEEFEGLLRTIANLQAERDALRGTLRIVGNEFPETSALIGAAIDAAREEK